MIDAMPLRRSCNRVAGLLLGVSAAALLAGTVPASAQSMPAPSAQDDATIATDGKKPAAVTTEKRAASVSGIDQSSVDRSSDGNDASDVVITGLRQSLANAQSIKRNADTVVDAITAEDIGALPDRSVNEALQRVPGVAITRFAAPNDSQHFSVEGSGVTIRGLSYTRGEFNGRDTFAVNGGREIGFNDVPTELVGSIEVYKNLTSDLIEGGISGTVSINTRKPFDSKDRLIYLSGGVNYGDLARKAGPSAVGLFSDQWELPGGGRIGALISGSYSRQFSRSDAVYLASPFPRYNDDKNGNGIQDPGEGRTINAGTPYASNVFDTFPVPTGFDHVYVPTGAGSRTQDFDRKRIGISGALQYENADRNLMITAQYLRADSREGWLEHTIEPNVYYADVTASFPVPGTSFTYDENGVFTSGTLFHTGGQPYGNVPAGCVIPNNGFPYTTTYCPLTNLAPNGQFTTFSNRYNYYRSLTQDQSLNIKWEPTDRLHINLDGQYVRSSLHSLDDIVDAATYSQVKIDATHGAPQITLVTPGFDPAAYYANPNSEYLRDAFNDRQVNNGHEWAFKADADYSISDNDFFRSVRVGARYSDREQTVRDDGYVNWGAVSDTWTSGGPSYFSTLPAGSDELYHFPNDFFRNDAVHPLDANFIPASVMKDHNALETLLRAATARAGGTYVPLEDRNGGDLVDGYFLPGEIYKNGEKTYAGYVKAVFGTDFGNGVSLTGNIGLRFVHTEDRSFGSITYPQSTSVLPVDNNVDASGNPLPPRFTTIPGYCAFDAAQAAANPNPNHLTPVICTLPASQQNALLAFATGTSSPDVAKQSYNNWLPSLNLKLQLTPKFLMRFAASKAISRPNFGSLRDYSNLGASGSNTAGSFTFQASSGNPYLKPVRATQFDLTAEWYFAHVGQLTGAVFYKDLSDIILDNYGFERTFTNNGSTQTVAVNGPANASGHAHVSGAEISYQQTFDFLPGILKGIGTQETFTYIKPGRIPNSVPANGAADGSRPPQDVTGIYGRLPLALLSKYNANANLFYDYKGWYARIAYSWRSKYLLTNRDCCFPFLPVFALSSGQADASLFYTFNRNFKAGLEVQNLFNEVAKTSFLLNADGLESPKDYHISDRQFQLSLRVTM